MEEAFTIKALLYALVLTVEESRKFNDKSKTKQRGRPMRCIMYIPRVLAGTCVLAGMCGLSIHIDTGVGLSAFYIERLYVLFVTYLSISRYRKIQT